MQSRTMEFNAKTVQTLTSNFQIPHFVTFKKLFVEF